MTGYCNVPHLNLFPGKSDLIRTVGKGSLKLTEHKTIERFLDRKRKQFQFPHLVLLNFLSLAAAEPEQDVKK